MDEKIRKEIQGAVDARIPHAAVQLPERQRRRYQTLKAPEAPEPVEGPKSAEASKEVTATKNLEKPARRAGFFLIFAPK